MSDDNVIDMKAHKPHYSGGAQCLHCEHRWIAVVAVADDDGQLQCPNCGLDKGVWRGLFTPPDGSKIWVCNCGNNFFWFLDGRVTMCPKCGAEQDHA
jgi:transcription elongation factor Elf1